MPDLALSESTITLLTTYAVRIVGVVAVLFVALIVAGWVRRLVVRASEKAKFDPTLTKFFGNMARYLVLILAMVACLGAFGIETTSFAAVLGAAGLAVGLALQGSLSNFAAGVMLLIFRPFKAGDVISVTGQTGKVEEIQLFVSILITPDNRRIILPNSKVFGTTIENVTAYDVRRVDVDVGVDYTADIDRTRQVLQGVAEDIAPAGMTEPQIFLSNLGASSVDWQVRVWAPTSQYWAIKEQLTRAVKLELDKASISIPFPQLGIHFDAASNNVLRRPAAV